MEPQLVPAFAGGLKSGSLLRPGTLKFLISEFDFVTNLFDVDDV